jgi:hypothetical protein
MSLKDTYIKYGVPSIWAAKYERLAISCATFKATSAKNLTTRYNIAADEVTFVKNCLVRQPIDDWVVQKLLENSRFVCCICKGQKSDGYIIHHIIEYSLTQDNSYENLAVVCPNDHDLAHRSGISLTNKLTEQQLRITKANWEKEVKHGNTQIILGSKPFLKLANWKALTPYKELQSFTDHDQEYFFGREGEIDELFNRINKYRIVGLFGESGTGKTSLLNAGLLPLFKREGYLSIAIRCLDEPVRRIREALIRNLKERPEFQSLIEEIASADTFSRLIVNLNEVLNEKQLSVIIVVDQFEELFTKAREVEREQLSSGITEALSAMNGNLFFLLSLREDYIGDLWDWANAYNLEDAWIHQFRIKRLHQQNAIAAITGPLKKLNIRFDLEFIELLVTELRLIGNGLIYPPYLQIVCAKLFDEYKKQCASGKKGPEFGRDLYQDENPVENIIAEYLSGSMLDGLTSSEKNYAQNILDLLTGPEGLRSLLSLDEVSRYTNITSAVAGHVIEHLVRKKIVHPVVENDLVTGYELVHDFLSKKFFEKLNPEAKKAKTTIEIFRIAFKEWKQHDVLASKDRLEILFPFVGQLSLNDEEWAFLLKSSFSVYWFSENHWIAKVDDYALKRLCIPLLQDKDPRIIENAIRTLAKTKGEDIIEVLLEIIQSNNIISVRDTSISQFWFTLKDRRSLDIFAAIIKTEKDSKLRKTAVYAFASNLSYFSLSDKSLIDNYIPILYNALTDAKTEVRKQAADALRDKCFGLKPVDILIDRLKNEFSVSSRKAIVYTLGVLCDTTNDVKGIIPILKNIASDDKEDYRVREDARLWSGH